MIASTTLGESGNLDLPTKQAIFAVVGLVAFFLVAQVDLEIWRSLAWPIYLGSLLMLAAIFLYGFESHGSVRWFDFGAFRLQPSELVKLSTILLLAEMMSTRNMHRIKNILLTLAIVGVPTALTFLQPDLGSAIVMLSIWLGMIMTVGIGRRYLIAGTVAVIGGLPLTYQLIQPYQRARLLSFLNPGSDPLGAGYNVIQSTIAVGSGEIFGRGFGRGTQSHLNFLPEHSTDFIFATLAEELGLFGALILLILLGVLVWRILRGIPHTDRFGGLVLVGMAVMISFQAAVNIGMNLGLAPVTGITLPLVSYGGSSLITILIGLGLAAGIIARGHQRKIVDLDQDLG